jgi:hypothetical protein
MANSAVLSGAKVVLPPHIILDTPAHKAFAADNTFTFFRKKVLFYPASSVFFDGIAAA